MHAWIKEQTGPGRPDQYDMAISKALMIFETYNMSNYGMLHDENAWLSDTCIAGTVTQVSSQLYKPLTHLHIICISVHDS